MVKRDVRASPRTKHTQTKKPEQKFRLFSLQIKMTSIQTLVKKLKYYNLAIK